MEAEAKGGMMGRKGEERGKKGEPVHVHVLGGPW